MNKIIELAAIKPISFFFTIGSLFIISGIIIGLPTFSNYLSTGKIGEPYIMRIIISGILTIIGSIIASLGLIAATIKENRLLIEKLQKYSNE